ncbi:MAG: hypothetical protein LBL59_07945 [Xanthomonadaceae bacterium]|jgi:hypothetical protein|nr:hypothetical protein [Xanthomonadaceae bacterium]
MKPSLRQSGARVVVAFFCVAALALTGCRNQGSDNAMSSGGGEPVELVRTLAGHLHDDDLLGFARTALPAADYQRLEASWREGENYWPLTELPMHDQFLPLLEALSAPGAGERLRRGFDRQFIGQEAELHDAVRTLGLFGVQYLRSEPGYSQREREHHIQVLRAVSGWGAQAPLADPRRAYAAISRLTSAAQAVGLYTEEDLQREGMENSLRRMGPFIGEIKATLADYGLDLDRAFTQLQINLVEETGDNALVRIRYPLGEQVVDTTVELRHVEGRWYLEGYLQRAERRVESDDDEPEHSLIPISGLKSVD